MVEFFVSIMCILQFCSWAFAYLIIINADGVSKFRTKKYFYSAIIPCGFVIFFKPMVEFIISEADKLADE